MYVYDFLFFVSGRGTKHCIDFSIQIEITFTVLSIAQYLVEERRVVQFCFPFLKLEMLGLFFPLTLSRCTVLLIGGFSFRLCIPKRSKKEVITYPHREKKCQTYCIYIYIYNENYSHQKVQFQEASSVFHSMWAWAVSFPSYFSFFLSVIFFFFWTWCMALFYILSLRLRDLQ